MGLDQPDRSEHRRPAIEALQTCPGIEFVEGQRRLRASAVLHRQSAQAQLEREGVEGDGIQRRFTQQLDRDLLDDFALGDRRHGHEARQADDAQHPERPQGHLHKTGAFHAGSGSKVWHQCFTYP